jgi:dephospho-CoA kinase
MIVIGLTGGIGSGKSTVADLFAANGVPIIDTDVIARNVTATGQPALIAIINQFGEEILTPSGELNRAHLRKIIFTDPQKKFWLEQLLHPLIRAEVASQVATLKAPYCIVVIPLLFETSPNPIINRVLAVQSLPDQQIIRVSSRDGTDAQIITKIIDSQISSEKRLELADDIIYNTASIAELIPQVNLLHEEYLLYGSKK